MIEKLQKEIDDMLKIKENTDKYRKQVEELESEISKLQREVAKTLDFDKDIELQNKRESLSTVRSRLRTAEANESERLKARALTLNSIVRNYQTETFKNDEAIETAYEIATNKIKEAYEAIQEYQDVRETKAQEITDTVTELGYDNAVKNVEIRAYENNNENVLDRNPTKINLTMGTYGGRYESAQKFFERMTNE